LQLLDSFILPIVMILSYFALRVRFLLVHFIGVIVALIGVGCMVGADVLTGKEGTDKPGNLAYPLHFSNTSKTFLAFRILQRPTKYFALIYDVHLQT